MFFRDSDSFIFTGLNKEKHLYNILYVFFKKYRLVLKHCHYVSTVLNAVQTFYHFVGFKEIIYYYFSLNRDVLYNKIPDFFFIGYD